MGRDLIRIDDESLWELSSRGLTQKEMAGELGISVPTLQKRLADLRDKQGLLLKYRELQSLELTSIQARILEAITPEKIDEATLPQLITAFKILKDKEQAIEGLPSDIKGLVGYLVELEKEEMKGGVKEDTALDGEYTELEKDEEEDDLPNL